MDPVIKKISPQPQSWKDYFHSDQEHLTKKLIKINIDLSEQLREAREQLKLAIGEIEQHRKRAETDHLTGVGSRHSIDTWADQYFNPTENTYIAIAFDLVNFKYLNDTFGHSAGDQALAKFASKLLRSFRFVPRTMDDGVFYSRDGLYVRQGGDEFAAVLMVPGGTDAKQFEQLIIKRITKVLYVGYDELSLSDKYHNDEKSTSRRVDCRYAIAVSEPGMNLQTLLVAADNGIVK